MWKAAMMRICLSLLVLLMSATSPPGQNTPGALMDEIEKKVQLPLGAARLERYARHYALQEDGKVIGVYVLHLPAPPKGADYGCSEIRLDGKELTSKPITCPPEPDISQEVAAGERRWFDDDRKLPLISDGGCIVVNVIFNPSAHEVESAFCNGAA